VRIIEAIVRDENSVLTVSSHVQASFGLDDVCFSLPSIVNRHGITDMLELPLEPEERLALQKSAQTIRSAIDVLGY
jgi:L-lactate dehydrogenase